MERYWNAARAAPGEALYLANLAFGLWQLAAEPQDYTEALDVAQRASALDPQNADYTKLHRDLESRQEFVRRFGSAAKNFKHDSTRLRVQASSPLLAHLIENDDLQPWLKQRIDALRETITQSHGFTLPLIRFTPLPDDDKGPSFALVIGDQVVCSEHFDGCRKMPCNRSRRRFAPICPQSSVIARRARPLAAAEIAPTSSSPTLCVSTPLQPRDARFWRQANRWTARSCCKGPRRRRMPGLPCQKPSRRGRDRRTLRSGGG
jgi:hypothetical protein